MNIINKLTLKQMFQNKKRTLITIIGVIISVAMVTGVVTIGMSFSDLLKRDTIVNQGNYHIFYKDVNGKQLKEIEKDKNTDEVIVNKYIGYAHLKGLVNPDKPYLYIHQFNKAGFNNFPIEIAEGRLPSSENEVVISEHILTNGKVKLSVGDKLNLNIGNRYGKEEDNKEIKKDQTYGFKNEKLIPFLNQEYRIVGIIKRPNFEKTFSPGYTVISYWNDKIVSKDEKVDAYVKVKKVDKAIYNYSKEFSKKNKIESYSFNDELLKWSGASEERNTKTVLSGFVGIILVLIIIASISLIYNAFAISISERIRYLGIVSSVGATRKQRRNSVIFEAFLIGVIGIPLGIISGLIGILVTFKIINPILRSSTGLISDLRVVVSFEGFILIIVASIITIYISAYIPARSASKISPIDAIRQTKDIKLTNKVVKTSKITRMIFGIEGEIALKNIKRNKKRYIATIFSFVISIVLFLSVSAFNEYSKKATDMYTRGERPDIEISNYYDSGENKSDKIDKLKSIKGASSIANRKNIHLEALIKEDNLSEKAKLTNGDIVDNRYKYYITIIGLEDNEFNKYKDKVGAKLKRDDLSAILINSQVFYDSKSQKYVEDKFINLKEGDRISLLNVDNKNNKTNKLTDINIGKSTNIYPNFIENVMDSNEIKLITSMDQLQNLIERVGNKYKIGITEKISLKSNDPEKLTDKVQEIIGDSSKGITVNNYFEIEKQKNDLNMVIAIFIYGFITLVGLICTANIFNTIGANIGFRNKEFAMLRSIGMTPKSFRKMIRYESLFYGIKALIYALPISFMVMGLLYKSLSNGFSFDFFLPIGSIIFAILAVFLLLSLSMMYASSIIRKENIIESLKQDNI